MKTLLLSLLFLYPAAYTGKTETADNVFICVSSTSYAYHKTKECRWLKNCTHKIEDVTEEEAKSTYKRKKCIPCYGK